MTNSPASALREGRLPQLRSVGPYAQTSGQEAIELARSCGLVLDDWQADTLTDALGERYDVDRRCWRWAAFRVGVVVSRQNGKGSLLEARVLAGLLLFGEKLIIWTAHEVKTAMEAMRRIEALIEASPDLRRRVKRYVRTNGNEGIEFTNGARLRFLARSKGSGRGFTADCLILDEAYALTAEQMSALMPTMAAVPNAQIWFTSSPPLDAVSGDVLFRLRDAALAAEPGLAYFDWGLFRMPGRHLPTCDVDVRQCLGCVEVDLDTLKLVDITDRRLWRLTNPAFGYRISAEFTAHELSGMDPVDFARERLGVWPARHTGTSVIDPKAWSGLADVDSQAGPDIAFAVDVTPSRDFASIAAYSIRADGLGHVELVDHRPGTDWVVDRLVELRSRYDPVAVGLDLAGPAGSLLIELEKRGVVKPENVDEPKRGELAIPSPRDVSAACGQFIDATNQATFRHIDQGPLNVAVAGAKTRPLGDAWGWARKTSTVDISPLVAVTLARWAYESRAHLITVPEVYDALNNIW